MAADLGVEHARRLGQIGLQFRVEQRSDSLRTDLSALCLTPEGVLWLASDEFPTLERLEWDGTRFTHHESFDLHDFFTLPAGQDGEIDIEGLYVAEPYVWVIGSHCRKIRKPKDGLTDKQNIKRLTQAATRTEPNRALVGRIPLRAGHLTTSCSDPRRPGERLTAAALKMADGRNALVAALQDDAHLGAYIAAGIPGKANGLDIEGLEVFGDRLLLGLRGPVLLDWAVLLQIEPRARKNGTLGLKKIGANDQPYRKFFVNLQGLGVRDLCRSGSDLLILAGPTQFLDGPARLFRLPQAAALQEDVLYRPEPLFDLPYGIGFDHPEGITLAHHLAPEPALLVVHDAPEAQRLTTPGCLLADLYALSATGPGPR